MNDKRFSRGARASRALVAAILALLFSGCAMTVAASALQAQVPGIALYASALVAVALCVLGATFGAGASVAFLGVVGVYVASHLEGLRALGALLEAWSGRAGDAARVALGARTLLTCGAFTCGVFFFALINSRELTSLAVMVLMSILVSCHAMSASASVAASVPGLVAAAAAFALTGGASRQLPALRALIPAALAVALALLLTPGEGTTFGPLEDAANRVRTVFEQYFRFTSERVAFSISEEGYDHAGAVGDAVISMLGGPADPRTEPVMRVETGADALLRGAIRTAYTGYSWVDAAPKNRYLYYDLTHRAIRDRVFTPAPLLSDALLSTEVSVELLSAGTSTLFVPGLMDQFSMDLSTAVYYNTAGEMFLTREVEPGDRYALRALLPAPGDALREAVSRGALAEDERYPDILAVHTALPAGIDGRVYTLTGSVVEGIDGDYDRALAIMNYLRGNMRYTLSPQVPPAGTDFVSHFLLDTREGYCSYYATAMAVMGRIAGLPTRYVEGYLARAGQSVLTGENAHAWAEVYFKGVGWIPFDATSGATGTGGGFDAPGGGAEGNDGEAGAAPGENDLDGEGDIPAPTPTLPPDGGIDAPTPSPEPDAPDDAPDNTPEEAPDNAGDGADDAPADAQGGRRGGGAWGLLALLAVALIALAVWWTLKRLRATDPEALCDAASGAHQAVLIAYRANLTLLQCLGQVPAGGETPAAFAQRVSGQLNVPEYVEFVRAVTDAAYARKPARRADVDLGLNAYARFRAALRPRERMRFALTRVFRGLGDFEAIP